MSRYRCEMCDKTFESGWSEEEALEEMKRDWGEVAPEHRAVICDHCHDELMRSMS